MSVIFNHIFYDSSYAKNSASTAGRIESIMAEFDRYKYSIETCYKAAEQDLLLVHSQEYIDEIRKDKKLFETALYSAGGAIMASQKAISGTNYFACIRPPGHHAHHDSAWGFCIFANISIAILKLLKQKQISSALIIDIDAHTGDGTIEIFKNESRVTVYNPMGETSSIYLAKVEEYLKKMEAVDIVGISAGFDNYIKDVGKKLITFDYYALGILIKKFAKLKSKGRIFSVLEGGYYIEDLGKNVLAFCEGIR